jgi:hypothetical protein
VVTEKLKTSLKPDVRARLTLQDALVDASTPTLRVSPEMSTEATGQLEPAVAKDTWQALQLSPQEIAAKLAELRKANESNTVAARKLQALQAQTGQLQQQVQDFESKQWQQPALIGASVACLAVGWLWLGERKKRLAAQAEEFALYNESNNVLEVPEGPTFNYAEPRAPKARISDLITDLGPQGDPMFYPAVQETVAKLDETEPWWKRSKRKPDVAPSLSGEFDTASAYPSTQTPSRFTGPESYLDAAEVADMQAFGQAPHDPDFANVELLSQTRIKPTSSEDAMGHLLEVRMAVQALRFLEQPYAAQKLLIEHIDAVPVTCAWAYFEYLELSAQIGARDQFEAMRKRYRLQFNRLAPYWMEPNAAVQSLDTYERPMADLCAVWSSPEQAKALISTWLLGTLHSRRLFQLPAYHDLLDLYEMLEFYDTDGAMPAVEFVPTVSLLDLDYEFAVEVTLDVQSEADALRAVPTVKTGDFAVDFNLTQGHTRPGDLTGFTMPAQGTPPAKTT